MLRFGEEPYLECSSKGDKRFSAFHARIKARDNKSIEEIYQAAKVFNVFGAVKTNLTWREAKGKRPINVEEVRRLYSQLWDDYIYENQELLEVLRKAPGLSDIFGQAGYACQAEELWRIRNKNL